METRTMTVTLTHDQYMAIMEALGASISHNRESLKNEVEMGRRCAAEATADYINDLIGAEKVMRHGCNTARINK